MRLARINDLVHDLVSRIVRPGDTVVDATAGNGNDTVFLAEAVGPAGRVLAFDVQETALAATRLRLATAGCDDGRCRLIKDCHSRLDRYVQGAPKVFMYNLGYRPGGDPMRSTRRDTTLLSLDRARARMAPGGLLSVVLYRGHPGGREEVDGVGRWAAALPSRRYRALALDMMNLAGTPPSIVLVQKMPGHRAPGRGASEEAA